MCCIDCCDCNTDNTLALCVSLVFNSSCCIGPTVFNALNKFAKPVNANFLRTVLGGTCDTAVGMGDEYTVLVDCGDL